MNLSLTISLHNFGSICFNLGCSTLFFSLFYLFSNASILFLSLGFKTDMINLSWSRCWRLWEVNNFQAGETKHLLLQMWTCVCQHYWFLYLHLMCALDADKTFVSKWFWWGWAEELYSSHPCQCLPDNKSMQNLKWCVGYFPFLHNVENMKSQALMVKLLNAEVVNFAL